MSSRDTILNRLRASKPSIEAVPPVKDHLTMTQRSKMSSDSLIVHFTEQAEKLGCVICRPVSVSDTFEVLKNIIGHDNRVLAWDFEHIPFSYLNQLVEEKLIVAEPQDASVRVGITGADAGLAATGSLVLMTGAGKPRSTSLLPPIHIAFLRQQDIVPDFEAWVEIQRSMGLSQFQQTASTMIISGPSRTADIAMQLTMGMHGPAELHIVIVN